MMNQSLRMLAQVISRLFGPFSSVSLLFFWLLIFQTGLSKIQQWQILPWLIFLNYLFPLGFLIYLRTQKRVSDFDLTRRQERNQWLNWVVLSQWLSVGIALFYHPTAFYQKLVLQIAVVFTLATLITFYKKISLHMVAAVTAYLVLNFNWGWQWWWLGIFLGFVGWARWYLKKHTLFQLALGATMPFVVLSIWELGISVFTLTRH